MGEKCAEALAIYEDFQCDTTWMENQQLHRLERGYEAGDPRNRQILNLQGGREA